MIKLIATDMDGTLLDENGNLPKDFFETLEQLKKLNIKFYVASGRPYGTLYDNFKPYSDSINYICDNGSYVVGNDGQATISVIEKNVVEKIVQVANDIDNIEIILCGTKHVYHRQCTGKLKEEVDKYYSINEKIVTNFQDIDDDIFKISICDLNNAKEHSFKLLNSLFGSDYKVVLSAVDWVDICNKNINKGHAIKKIQEEEGISPKETMVFGDYYNDIDMLKQAYYSFAMDNANDDIKKCANFSAESNKNNGVIKAIKKYILDTNNKDLPILMEL